jgi:hypothetical protein
MDYLSEELKKFIAKMDMAAKQRLMEDIAHVNTMTPNEFCWCGSGEKFSQCHLHRERKRKITRNVERHEQSRIFDKSEYCCASYDAHNCALPIKGAHTIQRSRVLTSIAKDGHVGTFYRNSEGRLDEKGLKTGIKSNASIFFGFCSYHDTEIFKAIEINEFSPSLENCWSSSYRAVCHEFYQKTAACEAVEWKIQNLDNGRTLIEQLVLQYSLRNLKRDILKGLDDISKIKSSFELIRLNADFHSLRSYIIEFDTPLTVAVCGTISPFYDIGGVRIQNFGGLQESLEHIALSTVCVQGRAVYVLSHLAQHKKTGSYLADLFLRGDDFLKNWLMKSIFAHVENNYFSLDWWKGISEVDKEQICELALSESYTSILNYDDFPARLVPGDIHQKLTV